MYINYNINIEVQVKVNLVEQKPLVIGVARIFITSVCNFLTFFEKLKINVFLQVGIELLKTNALF